MDRYRYEGPVVAFERCIAARWSSETIASTPAKAKNNLAYQFKRDHNMVESTKISLPGELKLIK